NRPSDVAPRLPVSTALLVRVVDVAVVEPGKYIQAARTPGYGARLRVCDSASGQRFGSELLTRRVRRGFPVLPDTVVRRRPREDVKPPGSPGDDGEAGDGGVA